MARYPHAEQNIIPAGSNDPPIIPTGMIVHVAASEGPTLRPWFSGPSGGVESHLYVRYGGSSEQYRDTEREADANLNGNSFTRDDGQRYGFVSVETEGLEDGEWTPEQLATLQDIYAWGAEQHGWPWRVCPGPYAGGLGYHVMWGAPGEWTGVSKTCPGPNRVDQFQETLAPWVNGGGEEDDMPLSDEDLNKIEERIWGHRLPQFPSAEDEGHESDGKRRMDYILRFAAARAHSGPTRTVNADVVPVPDVGYSKQYRDENPRFTIKYAIAHGWGAAERARARIAQAAGGPVEVDEQEIAEQVLSGLSPETIASAVANALPSYELVAKQKGSS